MTSPLWITYAWADNDEGDFDYLRQELEKAGIAAIYDKRALVPGRRLWEQIADEIIKKPLSGWAYLVTRHSLNSQACREELAYALQRALQTKGDEFPLIGLVHEVGFDDVPPALRVRLCIDLKSHDWIEQVRAGVSGEPPQRATHEQSPYVITGHRDYGGNLNAVAVEIRPRFGELTYWRIAYPSDGPKPTRCGTGPSGGGGISGMQQDYMDRRHGLEVDGVTMDFVGSGNTLTASTSAYAVFQGQIPTQIFFPEVYQLLHLRCRLLITHIFWIACD